MHDTIVDMKSWWRRAVMALLATLISLSTPLSAMALFDEALYYNNGIIFYNGGTEEDCTTEDCISTNGSDISLIGDEIGAGLKDQLAEQFTQLDTDGQNYAGTHGRTWADGYQLTQSMELKDIVIFALGTHSTDLTQTDIDNLVDALGLDTTIVLITNYSSISPEDYENNNTLFAANANQDNIIVVDWAAAAAENADSWLSDDGTTPTDAGYEQLATLIYEALNTCTGSATTSAGVTIGSSDYASVTDYAGNAIFTDSDVEALERLQPLYKQVESETGVPWQFLAALHYRETSFGTYNPSNCQGIFQLYSYTNGGDCSIFPEGEVGDDELLDQLRIVAEIVIGKNADIASNPTDDVVKRTFFLYNGEAQAYKTQARDLGFTEEEANNGEGSPYVMNKADAQRDPNVNGNNWGQIKSDGGGIEYPANQDYGAYVIYVALGGGSGSTCISSYGSTIEELAWAYSLQEGDDGYGGLEPNDAYAAALEEAGLTTYGDQYVQIGASCDAFVATVMRVSGADPDFYCCGTGSQLSYLDNSSKYRYIGYGNNLSTSDLQSGDILVKNGHIKFYIEVDGVGYEAQASYGDHTAQITKGVSLSGYHVFRLI